IDGRLTALARARTRDLALRGEAAVAAGSRLRAAAARLVADRRLRVQALGRALNSLGHRGTLARGYALVRDANGRPLRAAAGVAAGAAIGIEFSDGALAARVETSPPPPAAKSRAAPASKSKADQGSLL
ncbi:MAG: exodeoxyribonuclease VII large subunit, partial [Hyphomicrobiales bacterium]|nr:exodeoxyribonuclease VII large subunit [Hyphomicrobiales bacterium]